MPPRVVSALACACFVLLLTGCADGNALDVAEGRYRLYVEGSLTDTLTGPAIVREHDNGHVGIELGPRGRPGISIELRPPARGPDAASMPVSPRRYDVVAASLLDAPPPDSLAGLIAFLSLGDAQFAATQGHLSVTGTDDGMVGGTLEFEMVEQESDTPAERTVRVTGVLRATAP